jgi:tetratricopeptide (TPR) repeat protein
MNTAEAAHHEAAIDRALADGAVEQAEAQAWTYLLAAGPARTEEDPSRALWFRAAYLAAQVSLAAARPAQAEERLVPCLAVLDCLPEGLAARVRLLAAEALARLRRGSEARPLLEGVPDKLFARDPLLHLRILRIRLWLGDLGRVEKQLVSCDKDLEARGDAFNRALLLCEEGRARDAAGDLDRAERCWQRAEILARADAPGTVRADVLLQLGRLDHLRGRLPSALDRYDEALSCAGNAAQALEVRLRRLLVLLDANQWDRARSLADGLLDDSPAQLPEELRPLADLVRALLHGDPASEATDEQQAYAAAARGDVAAARRLYREALAAEPSPERHARLALALALLALGQKDRVDADSWLRRAEALARERDLPDVLWRALEGRGQLAAELDGDEADAERLWGQAVVVCEAQAQQFAHGSDAVQYRRQSGVLRRLLRAACRREDAARVFHFQELDRGRLLLDLWRSTGRPELSDFFDRPEISDLEAQAAACEAELDGIAPGAEGRERRQAVLRRREEIRVRLDHLHLEFLRSHTRREGSVLPALPTLGDLQRVLPAGALYLAPALLDEELYLLAATRDGSARVIRASGSAAAFPETLAAWRACLTGQLARYRTGLPLGRSQRAELDSYLEDLGRGPLGEVLSRALAGCREPPRLLLWVPEGLLHGLPLPALRLKNRYLIEDVEIVGTFSGALLVHQVQTRCRVRGPFRPALMITEPPEVLPQAASEGAGVAASFLWNRRLHGQAATRAALRRGLARARVVHFACHAHFDNEHPLAAHVALPSGEALRALDWLNEPVDGLPLVTLSACRSAEVAPLLGSEVFGLLTGLLGGGVRAVLAGLWPVADRETQPLMWRFYGHRLAGDLAAALARAQRETLADPESSPLFWSAFALFGDPAALPAPGIVGRWLGQWRRARHLRRYPEANRLTAIPPQTSP